MRTCLTTSRSLLASSQRRPRKSTALMERAGIFVSKKYCCPAMLDSAADRSNVTNLVQLVVASEPRTFVQARISLIPVSATGVAYYFSGINAVLVALLPFEEKYAPFSSNSFASSGGIGEFTLNDAISTSCTRFRSRLPFFKSSLKVSKRDTIVILHRKATDITYFRTEKHGLIG